MPTPVKTSDKMGVGAKGSGKHWTAAEVEARQDAQELARRKSRVRLKPPIWLKENEEAFKVWKEIVRKLKGDRAARQSGQRAAGSVLRCDCTLPGMHEEAEHAGDKRGWCSCPDRRSD